MSNLPIDRKLRGCAPATFACRLQLGHSKLKSTVRCQGIKADDALILSKKTDL